MSENAFTLAVWTREVFNNLPADLRMDDDRLFDEFIDPNRAEIERLFHALDSQQLESFSARCLEALEESGSPIAMSQVEEARSLVSETPRQQVSVIESIALMGAVTAAIIVASRLRGIRAEPGGKVEVTFYEGLPKGVVEIIKLLLGRAKGLNRIVKKLKGEQIDKGKK